MIRLILGFIFSLNLYSNDILFDINATSEVNTTHKVKHLEDDKLFHAQRESGFTLFNAINRAIELNHKIKAAHQVVIQDKQSVKEAMAGHLPTIDLSGDIGYETRDSQKDRTEEKAALTTNQAYKKVDLFLAFTQNIWSGGSIENAVNEKDAALKASLYDYRDKLETLVVDIATNYFNVVYAEIALSISQKNMKDYKKILKIVSIKEKNGAATKGDVNFIKANVDNAQTELVQRQKTLSDALAQYTYLLQTEDENEFPFEISTDFYNEDLNVSLKTAEQLNAKILKQKAYIKSTGFSFLSTQGSFHPTIDFTVNADTRNEFNIGSGKKDKLNALLTFKYNLYNGNKDEATAVRLLAKMEEQKYIFQDLKRSLVFEIKVLNRSVNSLAESLKLTENEVLSTRNVVNSYWLAFQHGTQDLQALQLAQRNLNRAEQDYAQYKRDLIINNFKLMQKTGVLLQKLDVEFKKRASDFKTDKNIMQGYYNLSEGSQK